jgi:gamma-tubulin complex component 3
MHAMSRHGDPFIREYMHRMLNGVSKPFFTMLQEWIYEGELDDPYKEFFITSRDVPDDLMWVSKYVLRRSMLPRFIPETLAMKILSIGKSLNFLRYTCGDSGWLKENITERTGMFGVMCTGIRRATLWTHPPTSTMHVPPEATDLTYGDLQGLEMSIDAAYRATSTRLLDILKGKFKLMAHLDALKRFLLLCQGDFCQYLMDALV